MTNEPQSPPPEPPLCNPTPILSYANRHDGGDSELHITRGDIAALAVRLIGVYAIVQALFAVAGYLSYRQLGVDFIAGAAIPVAIYAGTGIFLIVYSAKVAGWLLPRTAVVATEPPGHGPAQLQAIALSVIGVYLFVSAAPSLAYVLVMLLRGDNGRAIQYGMRHHVVAAIPQLVQYGGEAALGIWLFFGSKRLAAWWWGLRHPEFRGSETDRPGEGESPRP